MKPVFIVAAVVALLSISISCERWRYKECKAVGHSTMYCLSEIGGK